MPLFGGSDDQDHLRRASHGRPRLCSCVWTGGVLRPKQAIAADARLPMEMQRNMKPDDLPVQYMKGDFN